MTNINHIDIQVKIALYKEDIEFMLSNFCKIMFFCKTYFRAQ